MTIENNGFLKLNTTTVIQHDGVEKAFIPANAFRDDYFIVMNMTKNSVGIEVERDAFTIDFGGNNCSCAVLPPWAQAYIAITYSESLSQRVAQMAAFASDSNASGNSPNPGGDWLPKQDPQYSGTLTGGDAVFEQNPKVRGQLAFEEIDAETLITKAQAQSISASHGATILLEKDQCDTVGESYGAVYTIKENFDLRISGNSHPDNTFKIINDGPQIIELTGDYLRSMSPYAKSVSGGINIQPGAVWEFRTFRDGNYTKCVGYPIYSEINLG